MITSTVTKTAPGTLVKLAKRFKLGNRSTRLTAKLADQILNHIAAGNYITSAVQSVGVHSDTFNNWLELADQGKEPYVTFSALLKTAFDKAEVKLLKRIEKAGEPEQFIIEKRITTNKATGEQTEILRYAVPQWQASAWILERTRNDRFGERSNMTVQFAKGLDFVKKIQKVRETKAIKAEWREIPEPEAKQIQPVDALPGAPCVGNSQEATRSGTQKDSFKNKPTTVEIIANRPATSQPDNTKETGHDQEARQNSGRVRNGLVSNDGLGSDSDERRDEPTLS